MQIYNNIPIPQRGIGKIKYYTDLINSLDIGQCFDTDYKDRHSVRRCILYKGIKIVTRRDGDKIMVWRVS